MTDISTELLDGKNLATEGTQVPEWFARLFQFVSLLDMFRLKGQNLLELGYRLKLFSDKPPFDETKPIPDVAKVTAHKTLDTYLHICKELGLPVSAVHVGDMKRLIDTQGTTTKRLRLMVPELQKRIQDELATHLFFHVPTHEAKFYLEKTLFGEEVESKFPKTPYDIEEAGKCLATGRSTAAVFHLMRVMETGVQYFGKKLRVKLPEDKVWQDILNRINAKISKMRARSQRTIIYADLAAHLYNVKVAWRNPVMHPKESYTPEEAEDIFNHVKTFMRHLAKEL